MNYHPYIGEAKEFKFSFTKHATECAVIKFDDQGLDKAKETFEFFKLDQIYQSHNDEAEKIDELYHEFDKGVIEDMYQKLNAKGFFISKKRLLDIVYGHYVVKDPDNEILGKLRKDLYEQVKKLLY